MYSVEEVADKLNVSKVTVYAKLKKYSDRVVLKQGKKYVTDELLSLIKKDLRIKDIEDESINNDKHKESANDEIAIDREELINLNKDLINTLIEQLEVKDKQLEEKDRQITELHKLIENSQVLLKKKDDENPFMLQERFNNLECKLYEVKEKMDHRKEGKKVRFFSRIFK